MAKKTATKYDTVDYLKTPEAIAGYLNEALATGDTALISAAIGDIARAKGMSQVAKDTGLSREQLYKSLSENGNPQFSTVISALDALGFHLEAKAA